MEDIKTLNLQLKIFTVHDDPYFLDIFFVFPIRTLVLLEDKSGLDYARLGILATSIVLQGRTKDKKIFAGKDFSCRLYNVITQLYW